MSCAPPEITTITTGWRRRQTTIWISAKPLNIAIIAWNFNWWIKLWMMQSSIFFVKPASRSFGRNERIPVSLWVGYRDRKVNDQSSTGYGTAQRNCMFTQSGAWYITIVIAARSRKHQVLLWRRLLEQQPWKMNESKPQNELFISKFNAPILSIEWNRFQIWI